MDRQRKIGRYTHAEAILGSEFVSRLADTNVLLVGAGGIGCELRQSCFSPRPHLSEISPHAVKNIVLTGFGHITLLDLDTIDLSNLNRQFLFKKKDVKQSKATVSATSLDFSVPYPIGSVFQVAAQTAGAFNPNVYIQPIHANIKEPQFDIEWFQSFDIVLNALDNLGEWIRASTTPRFMTCCEPDARRHVNKMCMAAGIPLVESGTAGYLGQVQPLLKVCPSPRSAPFHPPWVLGSHGVFRLHTETNPKIVPSLHYPIDPLATDSLYCLGQKLISFRKPMSRQIAHSG
ncbi:hypothetical protein J3R83DRAFT_5358 [Lanmaoa asiatica]|nr:hypothetical protein J3R83DRAFT_5358 [Lanmaoa asiatica]